MTIQEWIKANSTLKDTAKMDELDVIIRDLDPLANIKTKEDALDFVDRNNIFKSGLDSAVSKAVLSHDEKFTADKLPGLLKEAREEAIKESNPEETPQDKRLRELEEKLADADKRDSINSLKSQLNVKAKELGYTGDAERYIAYGEKALEIMESDITQNKTYLESKMEEMKKEVYKGNPPPKDGKPLEPKDLDKQIFEARQNGDYTAANKLQLLKNTKPQQ
ncbi:MAG: hypothetical protein PF693_10950 [Spirochaetia bacterium]|jgi:hypothetical protein|nr:hypothetical protein [Spirochaetia bacterium]